MEKEKKKTKARGRLPDRSSEMLVNQRMLDAHHEEIKAEIRSLERRFDSHDRRFDSHDHRFDSVESKIESLDAKIDSSDAKYDSLRQEFLGGLARIVSLIEEEKNLNRAVLDVYQSLYDRRDRVEQNVIAMNQILLSLRP